MQRLYGKEGVKHVSMNSELQLLHIRGKVFAQPVRNISTVERFSCIGCNVSL